jgi:hypothetical protein
MLLQSLCFGGAFVCIPPSSKQHQVDDGIYNLISYLVLISRQLRLICCFMRFSTNQRAAFWLSAKAAPNFNL